MIQHNKRLTGILLAVTLILLLPLVAMQFTDEVQWTITDFITMGVLLLGTGLICEFVLRNVVKRGHRIAICAAVLTVFLLIWLELAVGLFGTPFGGQ